MQYYRLPHSRFFSLLLISTLILNSLAIKGQQTSQAPSANSLVLPKAIVVQLKPNGVKVPNGGHLQGVQCLNDSLLLITASSNSYSYYLLAQFNIATGKGVLISIHKISDSPFRHAGGCQLYEHTLAVGIEDNHSKDKSDILLISFDEKGSETARRVVAHRSGEVKRSTAGAVGFTKLANKQYMLVVGDWDSKNLDVYISKPGVDSVFDSLTTVHITDLKQVPSYQAINLFCDVNGNVHMDGFALDGTKNRSDEFMLLLNGGKAKLVHKRTDIYKCQGGASFRFGSGVEVMSEDEIIVYSCGRGTRPFTTINIFDNKGLGDMKPQPYRR